jgi:hypothetical protein
MVLQAFIDESYTDGGIYVLGGHIADPTAWESLSDDWKELLPFGTLDKNGTYQFKMAEMALNNERQARVLPFYRVIEKHVLCSISCTFNMSDLKRAKKRISVPNLQIDWGFFSNPYLFALRGLMDMFHTYKEKIKNIIPIEDKVNFIFDSITTKSQVLSSWEMYMEERPDEIRQYFGDLPQFADDKKFLPLQAADLWVWWVRRWTEEGHPEKMEVCDFGTWKAERIDHPKIAISFNEDQIVAAIISIMHTMLEPGRIIYDLRPSFLAIK